MTTDKTCECCGSKDYLVGVASSPLGAFSSLWCKICLKMDASPKWAIEGVVECCNGIKNISENIALIYFDKDKDSYVNYKNGNTILIKIKGGEEFITRTELINNLVRIGEEAKKRNEKEK